ncbi:hypothetical protein [Paenibacillus sp. USHLN196]|uniref:hypothetical protein n=1 Tax=Paenibacillus sp. USHLN196 TaxID=3081291 RepID=UPI003015A8E5
MTERTQLKKRNVFYNNKVRYFAFLWNTTSDDITVGSLFGEAPEVMHDGKDGQPLVLAWGSDEGHPLKDYADAYATGVTSDLPITFHKEGTFVINFSLRAIDSIYGGPWVSSATTVTEDISSLFKVENAKTSATYGFDLNVADSYEKRDLLSQAPIGDSPEELAGLNPVHVKLKELTPGTVYEGKARIAPIGAQNVQLWAKDTAGNWYDINRTGWGPAGGFDINLETTTEVYVLVGTEAGDQVELTLNLVDAADTTNVIATKKISANAADVTLHP